MQANGVGQRILSKVLPFFSRTLEFGPPPTTGRNHQMRRLSTLAALAVLAGPALLGAQRGSEKCDPENAGIRLPQGFCATVYAEKVVVDGDTLKNPRHMVIAPNGDVIVSAQGRGGVGGVWIL